MSKNDEKTTVAVQGAKRRKQLRTSRVTPPQQPPPHQLQPDEHPQEKSPSALEETHPPNSENPTSSSPDVVDHKLEEMRVQESWEKAREDDIGETDLDLDETKGEDDQEESEPEPRAISDEDLPPIPKAIITATTVITTSHDHTYKCPRCLQILDTQKEFTAHIRAHNEVKPHPDPNDPTGQAKVYYCSLCSKMLSSFSSLDRHMLVHSGERPFSCELCGQTFTTNGNMHRHKRTHTAKELQEYGEAMGGLVMSTGRRGGGRKRKAPPPPVGVDGLAPPKKVGKTPDSPKMDQSLPSLPNHVTPTSAGMMTSNPTKSPICPLCQESFTSEVQLESHILAEHKANPNKCDECGFVCDYPNMLQVHKFFHRNPFTLPPSSISSAIGPLCLPTAPPTSLSAFVPPSSLMNHSTAFLTQEFPRLAEAFLANEDPRHGKPVSAFSDKQLIVTPNKYISDTPTPPSALYRSHGSPGPKLSLGDNQESHQTSTSSNRSKSSERHDNSNSDFGADGNDTSSENGELIGAHDDHDPIIKDMKLKGEFPCRLCPAVYPNLRALKGHNKEHLHKAPYLCNVGACTYSSGDKSTLTRHMRTHTGEKPYECKLCNYGFTTKANCERHLKNKHGKTNREDIRDCLILHETDESEHSIPKMQQMDDQGNFRCKVCKQHFFTSDKVIAHGMREHPAYADKADHIFEELRTNRSNEPKEKIGDLGGPSMVPRTSHYHSLSQLRPLLPSQLKDRNGKLNGEKATPDEEEAPLDLSRPAKIEQFGAMHVAPNSVTTASGSAPQVSLPALDALNPTTALTMRLFSPLMIPGVPLIPGGPVPTSCAIPTTSTLATTAPPIANPMSFSLAQFMPSMASALNFLNSSHLESLQAEMKHRLQLPSQASQHQTILAAATAAAAAAAAAATTSNGTPVPSQAPIGPKDVRVYLPASPSQNDEFLRKPQSEKSKDPAKDGTRSNITATNCVGSNTNEEKSQNCPSQKKMPRQAKGTKRESKSDGDINDLDQSSDSESNYKMVIKDGVLMKKQKQRRYRTERPYGCDHCNARFTLRSNMERHIKQQHPDFWSSKPRGSRRSTSSSTPSLVAHLQEKNMDQDESKDNRSDTSDTREIIEVDSEAGENDKEVVKDPPILVVDEKSEMKTEDELVSVSTLLNSTANHHLEAILDSNGVDGDDEEEECQGEDEDMHDEEDSFNGDDSSSTASERRKSAYSAAPHKIQCPKCPRKFPWISSLNRHLLTHSGDKPYKCRSCFLLFTTKSNCDRHQLRKHGNNNNDQAFSMRNVSERPFKCELCPSSSFSTEDNLQLHRDSKHSKQEMANGQVTDVGHESEPGEPEEDYDDEEEDDNQDQQEQQQQQQHQNNQEFGSVSLSRDTLEVVVPLKNCGGTTKAEITSSPSSNGHHNHLLHHHHHHHQQHEQKQQQQQQQQQQPYELKGRKKKKSLMDTIAKLSSAVEKQGGEDI